MARATQRFYYSEKRDEYVILSSPCVRPADRNRYKTSRGATQHRTNVVQRTRGRGMEGVGFVANAAID